MLLSIFSALLSIFTTGHLGRCPVVSHGKILVGGRIETNAKFKFFYRDVKS